MITKALSQTDEKVTTIKMKKIKRDFIRTFATEMDLAKFLKDIDWEFVDEGISLNGKGRILQQGELISLLYLV